MKMLRTFCVVVAGAGITLTAFATADGPDHYRLTGVAKGDSAKLYAEANAQSSIVGELPSGSICLRNLSCREGLKYEGFAAMRKSDQQRQQALRWCQIEHQGIIGWIEGRYLAEGHCPGTSTVPGTTTDAVTSAQLPGASSTDRRSIVFAQGNGQVRLKGRIDGDETVDYRVRARAGQRLAVTLKGSHGQNYFNVLPPGSESAIFIGSTSGNRFEATLTTEGEYIIRVYLMRAAARRNASSSFGLNVVLTGAEPVSLPGAFADSAAAAMVSGETTTATTHVAADSAGLRTIHFPTGQGKVRLSGRVEGSESIDYRVRVGVGQNLSVTLRGSHAQNYFNVLPPGSEEAMFIGSTSGNRFERVATVEGEHTIRVYLMRAAARRNASSNFGLYVTLTGHP